jgi:hypothetical protein
MTFVFFFKELIIFRDRTKNTGQKTQNKVHKPSSTSFLAFARHTKSINKSYLMTGLIRCAWLAWILNRPQVLAFASHQCFVASAVAENLYFHRITALIRRIYFFIEMYFFFNVNEYVTMFDYCNVLVAWVL